MISPENDEEFGPFGQSTLMILNFIAPGTYKTLIIVSPSFNAIGEANIAPQFQRGDFFVLSSVAGSGTGELLPADISKFSPSPDIDMMLDRYRYEHAILANKDLSIVTAWAQAEYAVVAFKDTLLDEFGPWLEAMLAMGVVRRVP